MSLTSALNIGRTALSVNQAAIQTVGNNIANVGNPNYTRQSNSLSTAPDQQIRPGMFTGTGVQLDGIHRQIDEALEGRVRNSMSDSESASTQQQWLSRVESVFNELSDEDLSTQLSKFFNSWSNLANKPQDVGLRQVVLTSGSSVASWFHQMNGEMQSLNTELTGKLQGVALSADQLAGKIAQINTEIVSAEGGREGAEANGLRDQRDGMLKDLANIMEIRTVEQPNGVVNVYAGSDPIVFDGRSRGVTTVNETVDGKVVTKVVFKENGGEIKTDSGQLGGLIKIRGAVDDTCDQLDQLASSLSFELNKIHSSGQGLQGFTSVIGATTLEDSTVALNDPTSGLKQVPSNGSFVVHVTDKATGLSTSTMIKVDLDGAGADTTLDSLIAQLDAVGGITAVNNGGRLQITSDNAPAAEISFSQDSSGALAALGVNTFFSGATAGTIDINATLKANPQLLAAAKNGNSGDNQTARAIAALETTSVQSLGGSTLTASYQSMVNNIAAQSNAASAEAEAGSVVLETLQAQREAVSGVSLDEEAINLMRFQRGYQGAARLVSVVNELMDTMMAMAR
jgi:flagellar hook-associated protein 1 FlgK